MNKDEEEEKEGSSTENPYLALRAAKIARNQARLAELGLLTQKERQQHYSESNSTSNQQPTVTKRRPTTRTSKAKLPSTVLRRSYRLSSRPEETDTGKFEENSTAPVIRRSSKRKLDTENITSSPKGVQDIAISNNASITPSRSVPPKANSVRSISLDLRQLVHGSTKTEGCLGIPMAQTGKEFVIHESFELASLEEDKQRLSGHRLSFNKYSGVQEWCNDTFFLWVNLGVRNDNVIINDFLDGGKSVTWFGGSRMHDESPVIKDLIRVGRRQQQQKQKEQQEIDTQSRETETGKPSSTSTTTMSTSTSSFGGIVLWCRMYNEEKRTFGPYICMGRLGYVSHIPGSSPLSFVWNLLDYDALQNHSDPSVREQFQQVISC